MLTATFIHTPGVGPATERSLWAQGIRDWGDFLERQKTVKIAARHKETLTATIAESRDMLSRRQVEWFACHIPHKEHWRAAGEFPKIGYLDIETDGGMQAESITVIGLSDGLETRCYVKGKDLAEFSADAREYDAFVTFFGTGFDLPFLKRRFPELEAVFAGRLHMDLCPLLKRLGHKGGLKRIEAQLGIPRVPEADGLDGMDAVRLWNIYRRGGRGSDEALHQLLAYNKEDVVNMKYLLDYSLPRLQALTGYNEAVKDA